jgi:hypothetical protein
MIMAMRPRSIGIVILVAMGFGGTASGHHSQVLFDMNQCLTISGTVRTWQFESPHSWLWVIVPNAKGSSDVWGFEASSPAQMIEAEHRWKRDVVKPGDKVVVRYSPLKDGRTGGALNTVTLPDGTTLRAATPACAQAQGLPTYPPAAGQPPKGATRP